MAEPREASNRRARMFIVLIIVAVLGVGGGYIIFKGQNTPTTPEPRPEELP